MEQEQREKGFIVNLLERRVPQILSIYLGVGWGLIQFSEWLTRNFDLSPHTPQGVFLTLLCLVPSVVTVAYIRGANFWHIKWTWVEKFGIPINLVLTAFLIWNVTRQSAVPQPIEPIAQAEEVEEIQPILRKSIFIASFNTEVEDLKWLQSGISTMVSYDLGQDPWIRALGFSRPGVYEDFYKTGAVDFAALPRTFWRNQALTRHCKRFVIGTCVTSENGLNVTATLVDSETLSELDVLSLENVTVFAAVDEVGAWIRLKLFEGETREDLPIDSRIQDIFAFSQDGAKLTCEGLDLHGKMQQKDSLPLFEKVLELEPQNAFAKYLVGIGYTNAGNTQKGLPYLEQALNQIDQLPENMQFDLRSTYYLLKGEGEKLLALYETHVQTYPDDHEKHLAYARMLLTRNRQRDALIQFEQVAQKLEEPSQVWIEMADIYEQLELWEDGQALLEKYIEKFPKKVEGFRKLGNFYCTQGRFEEAFSVYQKGEFLEPNNLDLKYAIAMAKMNIGEWQESENMLLELLGKASSFNDVINFNRALVILNVQLGRKDQFYQYLEACRKAYHEQYVQLGASLNDVFWVRSLIYFQDFEKAKEMMASAKLNLTPPFDALVELGEVEIAMGEKDFERARQAMARGEEVADTLGDSFGFMRTYPMFLKGDLALEEGDYKQAIKFFESYLQGAQNWFPVNVEMAEAYLQLAQPEKALEWVQKGLVKQPASPQLNLWAAETYEAMGDRQKVQEHLDKVSGVLDQADPNIRWVKNAKALQQQVGSGAF